MKNFDDFLRVLTNEENQTAIKQIIAESAWEERREGNDLHIFMYDMIDAVTDYKLRIYHEWAFGDDSSKAKPDHKKK